MKAGLLIASDAPIRFQADGGPQPESPEFLRDPTGLLFPACSSYSSTFAEALREPAGHEIEVAGCKLGGLPGSPGSRALPRLLRAAGHRRPQAVIRPGEDPDR